LLLLAPPPQVAGAVVKPNQTAHAYTPIDVLQSPVFYVMYLMFVLIAAGGLTMAASMAPIAEDFKISKIPVELFGMILPALGFALFLNRIFDGVGRPFFGWLSDQIGREYTMALAFLIGAGALFTLSRSGSNPVIFVLVTALYFGVYGEIFSLFPATQGDTFGSKYAAANNGMLYTAKGAGSLLVPIAAIIAKSYGWGTVFTVAMTFNVMAALLALFVLKPMRTRHFAKSRASFET
jgi:OFA family oxalate/formate antiporter-like MFS transporter